MDDDDPLLGALDLDYQGVTLGVRWDFSNFATLKAEVRSEEFGAEKRRSSFWLQLAFVFNATPNRQDYSTKPEQTWQSSIR